MGDLGPVDRSSIGSHDLLFLPFSYLLYYINIIDNSSLFANSYKYLHRTWAVVPGYNVGSFLIILEIP